ncbi:MAG TPA: winged helix-turn-helix domain-containing protein [Ktedonobacteraceae bacterium]|nr:winged helix-turn-helix domain-containing protein [Ktedonobacteraceae bacterium]
MQSYAVLEEVATNLRSGLILLDTQEQVAFSNRSAERLLGVNLREMLDGPVFDVRAHLLTLAAQPGDALVELERLWLHTDEEQTTDLALADAAVRWLRVHSFPVRDEPGHLLGRGVLLDDSTLEHEAAQASSETFAMAAHELKTPLAVIKGCATTLLGNAPRWDPALIREMLQMIDTQADRLHDVIHTLLDVWRLDAGVQSLRLAEVRLTELLASIVERWRKNAPRHTFNLRLPDQVVTVRCDALRIEQAIIHLLSNAVSYSPLGSVVTARLETNETEIRLSISDQGIGIAPEHLERIFTRFYRVPHALLAPQGYERPGGNGLGLAVARATIEAHGGSIWAESAGTGHGATFYCILPRCAEQGQRLAHPAPATYSMASSASSSTSPAASVASAAASITTPHATESTGTLPLPRTGPLRAQQHASIAVVEHDPRMARYIRANLEEQRYQVYTASHGLQFLRQLDLQEPDLALLASDVGDMSGAELLEHLREFSHIPVLMLCDDNEDEDARVRYLDLGADDFVVKPLSMKELLARVRVLLRRRGARDDAASEPVFTSGDLVIDFAQHQVFAQGRAVQLSRTEYKLLSVMAQNAGRVMTHELLLERVWGAEYSREVDFIWVYISRLRRKIEADPRHPRYILTVPDVGYKLAKLS